MTVPQHVGNICPKCETDLRARLTKQIHVVDVAHQGESWDQAERKIHDACNVALFGGYRGLKVIHGHGDGRGIIRSKAVPLMKALAKRYGGRFADDQQNPGAHLIYFDGP